MSSINTEYSYSAVPTQKRKSVIQIAAVWMGFTMAASLTVLGGVVQSGVGVQKGLYAIFAGNLMLFLYSTLIGYISFKSGLNFSLVAKRAFGEKGFVYASMFLSLLVLGWFAVQADLFGVLLQKSILSEYPRWMITLPCALLFMSTALMGYRAMVALSYLVIPSFLALGGLASFKAFNNKAIDLNFIPEGATMGMGTAITIVASSFIVSATLTGDLVRWSKSLKDVIIVHFLAFIVGLGTTMVFGLFLSASGEETDIISTLLGLGIVLPAILMTGINLWSTCDNCLYNASLGFSNQIKSLRGGKELSYRTVTISIGLVGVLIATLGAFGHYDQWLIFLGTVVPPAGGVIMADYYLVKNNRDSRYSEEYVVNKDYKLNAFIAWIIGVVLAYTLENVYPAIPAAYVGVAVSAMIYFASSKINK